VCPSKWVIEWLLLILHQFLAQTCYSASRGASRLTTPCSSNPDNVAYGVLWRTQPNLSQSCQKQLSQYAFCFIKCITCKQKFHAKATTSLKLSIFSMSVLHMKQYWLLTAMAHRQIQIGNRTHQFTKHYDKADTECDTSYIHVQCPSIAMFICQQHTVALSSEYR